MNEAPTSTADYVEFLQNQNRGWKRFVDVQIPYRFNIRRICHGAVLEVGCGLGRHLKTLGPGAIGVEHNDRAIEICRAQGLTVYSSSTFASQWEATGGSRFDTLLFSHVLEHLERDEGRTIVREYMRFLRPGGRLVAITPQERGFASDPTHVSFCDFETLAELAASCGFRVEQSYSFPLPRWAGRAFQHNEFVVVSTLQTPQAVV